MKVFVPTADYPPIEGGISTVTVQVARELAALGHDVSMAAPRLRGQEDFDAGEPYRVVRYRGYGLGWLRLLPMLAASWSPAKGADLIVGINVAYGGIIGRLLRRVRGTRYIVLAYGYEFLKFRRQSFPARLLRGVYAHAAKVVAISRFTQEALVGFGVAPGQVAVVHPGAVPADKTPETTLADVRRKYLLEGRKALLAVGRLMPRKGHMTLVRALPRIVERFPDTMVVVVGRGPMMQPVIQEARALNVRDHILMPGRLPDETVAALYDACDVFVLPTGTDEGGQVEGFGLVFTEAHAHGKPVVAGRSGGVTDAVEDGRTGLLVDPDDPDAVADAVLKLLGDQDLARRLGENGLARVKEELNWATFTRRMLEAVEAAP